MAGFCPLDCFYISESSSYEIYKQVATVHTEETPSVSLYLSKGKMTRHAARLAYGKR